MNEAKIFVLLAFFILNFALCLTHMWLYDPKSNLKRNEVMLLLINTDLKIF
jgi:hypothetical protein